MLHVSLMFPRNLLTFLPFQNKFETFASIIAVDFHNIIDFISSIIFGKIFVIADKIATLKVL